MLNPFSKYGRVSHALPTATGKTFFVASDSVELTRLRLIFQPDEESEIRVFETIQAAVAKAVSNRGDVILVAPGHAETVATAGGIDVDVDGLTVTCLGEGGDRPTFTFSATDATLIVSGDSVKMSNFVTVPSIDSVVSPVVVKGSDCELNFEHRDASSAIEALRAVLTEDTADNLTLKLRYVGYTAGNACLNAVRLVGGSNARIDIDAHGNASTGWIEFNTTAVVNCLVEGYMYNAADSDGNKDVVDVVTGSTWYARVWDGSAGSIYSGGSANPISPEGATTDDSGTDVVIQKTLTSRNILLTGVNVTTPASGDFIVKDVSLNTDGTGLAGGTNIELINTNDNGTDVILAEAVASLGANVTKDLAGASVTSATGTLIESGKELKMRSTGLDCSGVGEMTVTIVLGRITDGAQINAT